MQEVIQLFSAVPEFQPILAGAFPDRQIPSQGNAQIRKAYYNPIDFIDCEKREIHFKQVQQELRRSQNNSVDKFSRIARDEIVSLTDNLRVDPNASKMLVFQHPKPPDSSADPGANSQPNTADVAARPPDGVQRVACPAGREC